MKKILYACVAASLLSGCGLFGKDALDIDGERISVIREDKNLQPEFAAGQVKVKLPHALTNTAWTQSGMTSEHIGGHLKAGGNLDDIWSVSFGDGSSKRNTLVSSPIIFDQKVMTIDAKGIVKAFDLNKGRQLWKRRLKHANKEARKTSIAGGGLAAFGDKVFATTGFGKVFALSIDDGTIIWEQDIKSPIRIAPTVNEDLVIAQTLDNGLYALNINTGEIVWKDKQEAENTIMIGGAAPAYKPTADLVVAAFSNGQLQAYKASTGTPLWSEWLVSTARTDSMADITSVKANPIIDETMVFAVGYNSPMIAVDIRTGVKLWQKDIAAASQPWSAGKFLFVLTTDGDLAALEKQTGKVVWTTIIPFAQSDEKAGIFASGPVLANDALLVVSSNGKLFSVSPYNGRIMGVAEVEDGIETSPIMADETLLLTTKDAEITAYK